VVTLPRDCRAEDFLFELGSVYKYLGRDYPTFCNKLRFLVGRWPVVSPPRRLLPPVRQRRSAVGVARLCYTNGRDACVTSGPRRIQRRRKAHRSMTDGFARFHD
jgi:hypothetical protein